MTRQASQVYTYRANEGGMQVQMPDGIMSATYPTEQRSGITIGRLHAGGIISVPPHWHEKYTEHMRVLQGYLLITIGNKTKLYGPEDGVVDILPFQIHTISQGTVPAARPYLAKVAGLQEGWEKEDVIFEEWNTPIDGVKEIFFRNMFGFYKDFFEPVVAGKLHLNAIPSLFFHFFELVNQSRAMDNYMLLLPLRLGRARNGSPTWLARISTYTLYRAALLMSLVCGFEWWRKEYTPVELHAVCKSMQG